MCEGAGTTRQIVLGTDTDIALFSMDVEVPLRLRPGQYPTAVAPRTVSEALAKAASQILEIEPGEIIAEYRPSLTPEGRESLKAEIFLYDTLPGGAGFSSRLVEYGTELFQLALRLVKACPENVGDPTALAPVIPRDLQKKQLSLWRFTQNPNYE